MRELQLTVVSENTGRRAFETLRVMSESPDGRGTRLGIWAAVEQRVPLLPEETEKTSQKNQPRGFTNDTFASDDLVNAGYLVKVERGLWEITEEGRAAIADGILDGFYDEVLQRSRAVRAERKESRQEALASTIVAPNERSANIRKVSQTFVDRGLRHLDSVFAPGRGVWRAEVVAELIETFVGQPLVEGDDFGSKLAEQLKDSSDDAKLLMAEVAAWQVLPLQSPGELKKRQRIQMILDSMEHPVVIPTAIDSALKSWSFHAGRGMASQIYRGLDDDPRDREMDRPGCGSAGRSPGESLGVARLRGGDSWHSVSYAAQRAALLGAPRFVWRGPCERPS
jgi:5-methylcytosine-specific restriction protein B